jgi:hypothetical protein
MTDITLDIETIPGDVPKALEERLFAGLAMPEISAPAGWKDEGKIRSHIAAKTEEAAAKLEDKKREIRSEYALSPLTGRVACIVCLIQSPAMGRLEPLVLRWLDVSEEKLLARFWSDIRDQIRKWGGNLVARWITFNGKDFDVPFLRVRSAVNRITPAVSIDTRRFDWRYHFDVRELLTNFGKNQKGKLDDWCEVFGVGSKSSSGENVSKLWTEGKFDELLDYCEQDVRLTNQLAQRLMTVFT